MPISPNAEQALDFAARIDRLGATQEFVGRFVGLSQSEVSRLVSGVRLPGDGHRKLDAGLRELENVAEFFLPMKPMFDDPDAVKEWLRSPSLPNLFKLLTDAQLAQLKTSELTAVNALFSKGDRLEEEIARTQERSEAAITRTHEEARRLFLDWLSNPSGK